MIVPDWFVKVLRALGLKDSPEKTKAREIAMLENKLREIRKQIDKNNDEIASYQLELNELINEKNRLMANYKNSTDETQRKILAANFDTAENKVGTIRHDINLKEKDNGILFAQEQAIKTILANVKGPEIEVIVETKEKAGEAKEERKEKAAVGKELEKMNREEEAPAGPSTIEKALAAEIDRESSASSIEAAIAKSEKTNAAEAVEQ